LGVALLEALAGLKETAKDLSQGNRFSVEAWRLDLQKPLHVIVQSLVM
jgi:hypothetical protein